MHRRLRPEEYSGRLHGVLARGASYPIGPELLLRSPVLGLVAARHGSSLLPHAYPEGAPAYPSCPSRHATFVGAGATMLKAFFDDGFPIPDPVVASDDGLSLRPWGGPPLTVGGELNKLAWNITLG